MSNDADLFAASLRQALQAECRQTRSLAELPETLDRVAETLKKHGLKETLIQAALLSLCGVPVQPLSFVQLNF